MGTHDASMMIEVWKTKHKSIEVRLVAQAIIRTADPDARLRALEMLGEIEEMFERSTLGEEFTEGVADLIVEQERK